MSAADAPLRVGFVGCGGITQHGHLPALRNESGIEVAAVADTDPERLRATADAFDVPQRYEDAAGLLADPSVEVVAICVPVSAHLEVALSALEAGKPVFMEKPIALTLAESDLLLEEAAARAAQVQMGFNLRWHRLVREARRRLPEIGRVVAVHSTLTSDTLRHDDAPAWRRRRAEGGGEFFETAVHHFDLWRHLLGTEIEEVSAASLSERWDDETAVLTARLGGGTLASALFSVSTGGSHEIEIYGEEGRMSLHLMHFDGLRVARRSEAPWSPRHRLRGLAQTLASVPQAARGARSGGDLAESYRAEWRDFARCVRSGAAPSCTLEDGRRALRAVLAAAESASKGRPVPA